MLSLANQRVVRAMGHFLGPADAPALWTITAAGQTVGSLAREAGGWRPSWFPGADRRPAAYVDPIDGDVEALADLSSARLGAPVRPQSAGLMSC